MKYRLKSDHTQTLDVDEGGQVNLWPRVGRDQLRGDWTGPAASGWVAKGFLESMGWEPVLSLEDELENYAALPGDDTHRTGDDLMLRAVSELRTLRAKLEEHDAQALAQSPDVGVVACDEDRPFEGDMMHVPEGEKDKEISRLTTALHDLSANYPNDPRHRLDVECSEFLCLPEDNPSHYCAPAEAYQLLADAKKEIERLEKEGAEGREAKKALDAMGAFVKNMGLAPGAGPGAGGVAGG